MQAHLMELPITHGFAPDRHLVHYDCPIYKNTGDFCPEKLCLVDRVEATENHVNTSGKAGAQIIHPPLGDDSSPLGDNAVGR
jgi:hypothetical protein